MGTMKTVKVAYTIFSNFGGHKNIDIINEEDIKFVTEHKHPQELYGI